MITTIGVTVQLRAADRRIPFAATFTGIGLKFLIRVSHKHRFNPGWIGIVSIMLLLGREASVSPGQLP